MADTNCLALSQLRKRYEGFTLDGVSLEVRPGEIVGLVGRNGAGKTTLMNIALGLVHADGGSVELFGRRVSDLGERELAALRSRVAFVSDVLGYPSMMSASEVARMYELLYPRYDRAAFASLCQVMGFGEQAKQVKDLSRGTGMKLQLACALASGAELLIMDEPTAGLDPIVRDEVLGVLREWMETEGRAILISSHITDDLERLADRIALIDEGKIVLERDTDEIAAMGVARLRTSDFERVLAEGAIERGSAHVVARDMSLDLLVPDRAAFIAAYPEFICDRAGIDDIMVLLLKGEVR